MANEMITKLKVLSMKQESTDGTAVSAAVTDAILASGIETDEDLEVHERMHQGNPGSLAHVPGMQSGSLSFTTELKGDGSTTVPELDEVLTGCFGAVVAANLDSTISGSSGSTTVWDVTDATNGTVGSMVMLETGTADQYECAGPIKVVDTGATPDDLTVALAAVNGGYATAGKKVKEMRTWQILLPPTANNSLTADVYYSSVSGSNNRRDRIVGCRGTFKMDSPRAGAIPAWAFSFKGWSVARVTNAAQFTPTYDSATPKAAVSQIMRLDGTYTHAFDISVDLGAEIAPKASQYATSGTYGQIHTLYRPKISFKIHPAYSSVAAFTELEAGTSHTWLFQVGNALYGTWAFYAPRLLYTKVTQPDDSGLQCYEIEAEADYSVIGSPTAATLDAALYLGLG